MFDDLLTKKLKEGEEVVFVMRKHWASFLKQMFICLVILVVPFFFIVLLFSRWWTMLIFLIWVSIGIGYGLYSWFVWYFDSMILTNQRIINIDQKRLFVKRVSEASLANIQDITYEIHGIVPSIFSYGSIHVQTAGSQNVISIDDIANPGEVQERIINQRNKVRKNFSASDLVRIIEETKKK